MFILFNAYKIINIIITLYIINILIMCDTILLDNVNKTDYYQINGNCNIPTDISEDFVHIVDKVIYFRAFYVIDDIGTIYENCIDKFNDTFPLKQLHYTKKSSTINSPIYAYVITKSGDTYNMHMTLCNGITDTKCVVTLMYNKINDTRSNNTTNVIYTGTLRRTNNECAYTVDQNLPNGCGDISGIFRTHTGITFVYSVDQFSTNSNHIIDMIYNCDNAQNRFWIIKNKSVNETALNIQHNVISMEQFLAIIDDDIFIENSLNVCNVLNTEKYRELKHFYFKYNDINEIAAATNVTSRLYSLNQINHAELGRTQLILKQLIDNLGEYTSTLIIDVFVRYKFALNFMSLHDKFDSKWIFNDITQAPIPTVNDKFMDVNFGNIVMKRMRETFSIDNANALINDQKNCFIFSLYYSMHAAYNFLNFAHGDILFGRNNNILYDDVKCNKNYVGFYAGRDEYYIFKVENNNIPSAIIFDFGNSNINMSGMNQNYKTSSKIPRCGTELNFELKHMLESEIKRYTYNTSAGDAITTKIKQWEDMKGIGNVLQRIFPNDGDKIMNVATATHNLMDGTPSSINRSVFTEFNKFDIQTFLADKFSKHKYTFDGNNYTKVHNVDQSPIISVNEVEIYGKNNNLPFMYDDVENIFTPKNKIYYDKYKFSASIKDCFNEAHNNIKTRIMQNTVTSNNPKGMMYYVHGGLVNLNIFNEMCIKKLMKNVKTLGNHKTYELLCKAMTTTDIDYVCENGNDVNAISIATIQCLKDENLHVLKYIKLLYCKLYNIFSGNVVFSVTRIHVDDMLTQIKILIRSENKNMCIDFADIGVNHAPTIDINVTTNYELHHIFNLEIPHLLDSINLHDIPRRQIKLRQRILRLIMMILFVIDNKMSHFGFANNIDLGDYSLINILELKRSIIKIRELYDQIPLNHQNYIKKILNIYGKHNISDMILFNDIDTFSLKKNIREITEQKIIDFKKYDFENIAKHTLVSYSFMDRIYSDKYHLNCNSQENCNSLFQNVYMLAQIDDELNKSKNLNTMYNAYDAQLQVLDVNQKLRNFSGSGYDAINSYMIGMIYGEQFFTSAQRVNRQEIADNKIVNAEIMTTIANMKQHNNELFNYFENNAKGNNFYVYRGENFGFSGNSTLLSMDVGDIYVTPTHTSTTLSLDSAFSNKSIMLRIKMHKNAQFVVLLKYSSVYYEREITIPFGTVLKITNKHYYLKNGGRNKIYVIDMEYVNNINYDDIDDFIKYYKYTYLKNNVIIDETMRDTQDVQRNITSNRTNRTPLTSLAPSTPLVPLRQIAGGNKKYDDSILKRKLKKYNHKMNKIINMNGGAVNTMSHMEDTIPQLNKVQQLNNNGQQSNNDKQQMLKKVDALDEQTKVELLETAQKMKLTKDKLVMNKILEELSEYKNKSYDDALTFILTKIKLRMEEQQLLKIYYNKKQLILHDFLKMFPDAGEKFGLDGTQIIDTLNFSLKENTHVYTNVQTYYEFNDGEVQTLIHINSAKESANVLFDTSYIYTDNNINVVDTFATIINLLMYEASKFN